MTTTTKKKKRSSAWDSGSRTSLRPAPPQPWMKHGHCRKLSMSDKAKLDLFFSEKAADVEAAQAICATCPVKAACEEYARRYKMNSGVWGQVSSYERSGLAASRRRQAEQRKRETMKARSCILQDLEAEDVVGEESA